VRALAAVSLVVIVVAAGCGGSASPSTAADRRLDDIARSRESVLALVRHGSKHRPGTPCSLADLQRSFTAAGVGVRIYPRRRVVAPPLDDPPFALAVLPENTSLAIGETKRDWAWATMRHVTIGADRHIIGVVDRIVAAGC
jgi:hypothetical protein